MFEKILHGIVKIFLGVKESEETVLSDPKKILIVRQHNQLGDMLASVSLYRAIKEKYPESKIFLIVSPENSHAVLKNKFIDDLFIFNKSRLLNFSYLGDLKNFLRKDYDLAIVPSTVSISFTSNLLAAVSDAKTKIGVKSLNGKKNPAAYLFHHRIDMDWSKNPDANVADFGLDIVRPFGIDTQTYSSEISYDLSDEVFAKEFLRELKNDENKILIGLHVGAGKPPNRWPLFKFLELIEKLDSEFNAGFYLTGSSSDKTELDYVKSKSKIPLATVFNKKIPEVAAVIDHSDLFIANDTGIMHVAGAVPTPQVSIFGPTNPFNWAPIGENKKFVRKSDLVGDVEVNEVFSLCVELLNGKKK